MQEVPTARSKLPCPDFIISWSRGASQRVRMHLLVEPCGRDGRLQLVDALLQSYAFAFHQAHRHGRWRRGRGRNVWCRRLRESSTQPCWCDGPDQGHFGDTSPPRSLKPGGITHGSCLSHSLTLNWLNWVMLFWILAFGGCVVLVFNYLWF